MAMSKQDFIALADAIREHNTLTPTAETPFTAAHLETLAHFCKRQNYNFMKSRWVGYIDGTNGPSGGSVKPKFKVPANGKVHKFATIQDASDFCNGYFQTSGIVLTIQAI
jgi:hypothetical protein